MSDSHFRHLQLDPKSGVPLITQLAEQLTWLIASGELPAGVRLPPIRELAGDLGIHMHTVRQAYQRLEAEGLVSVRTRRGTVVLDYNPAAVAQRGLDSPSYLLGVILPSPASFYTPFIHAIQDLSRELRYLPLFCYTFENPYLVDAYFNQLIARQVDGFIFASIGPTLVIEHPESISKYPPMVSVDVPDMPGCRVLLDSEGAAYQLTRHLIEHGHERIGLVTPPLEWPNVAVFYQGYERALVESGWAPAAELISLTEGFFEHNGKAGTARLLEAPDPPTALVAASDSLALGALQAITARGLSVPDDIALVGYNDIPAASLVDPGITTMAVPAAELGDRSLRLLHDLLEGRQPAERTISITTELTIRRSCGC